MPAFSSTAYVRFLLLAILLVGSPRGQAFGQPDAPDFGDFGGSGFGDIDFGGNQSSGEESVVTLEARFSEASEESPAMVQITATIGGDYHIYAIDQGALPDGGGPNPTVVTVKENENFRLLEPLQALTPPEIHYNEDAWESLPLREHYQKAVWYAPIEWTQGVDPKSQTIQGSVRFQACTPESCLPPETISFTAQIGEVEPVPPAENPQTVAETSETNLPLLSILGSGLLGGLILNLMPCVLPVIGLKVMSFAKQGGESRSHILLLNVAYAAGLLTVFMILAVLASLVQLGLSDESYGWGELYTLTWFKVTMTCFVFAMALSFLGVWELPIPGFATTGKATELTAKEGPSGAFFMGVFTTILAVPCSGPFLGPVFGYTIAQPTPIIFAIFTSVGIGMALPYLLIGLFPSLIGWVPKPGAWMDTFKNLMGFVLLGTVVYLFSTLNVKFFLPTLTLCMGIWFACWWIGRTPITASETQKNAAYFGGLGTAALIGFLAFRLLSPSANQLPWQPYSPDTLAAARAQGKTVLVDFTANWCLTCKTNLKFAINQEEVLEKVEENNVVTLLADWTDRNATIKAALEELDSISIPLMAIYPAGNSEPIVLPDLLTKQKVLEALDEAGPSLDSAGTQQVSRRYPVTR